jgi:hypothetical protein
MSEWLQRSISFSGYDWKVKGSDSPVGPGPNFFSDDEDSVWVDGDGLLHLRITQAGGVWRCAEVVSETAFGYGQHLFRLRPGAELTNENAVLGLFTWDTDPAQHNREIDIELSRWGRAGNDNCQFVVQPYERAGNVHRFPIQVAPGGTDHYFNWQREGIEFRSVCRHAQRGEGSACTEENWVYQGSDIPTPGRAHARINLWLFRGAPPSDGNPVEIIITKFAHAN